MFVAKRGKPMAKKPTWAWAGLFLAGLTLCGCSTSGSFGQPGSTGGTPGINGQAAVGGTSGNWNTQARQTTGNPNMGLAQNTPMNNQNQGNFSNQPQGNFAPQTGNFANNGNAQPNSGIRPASNWTNQPSNQVANQVPGQNNVRSATAWSRDQYEDNAVKPATYTQRNNAVRTPQRDAEPADEEPAPRRTTNTRSTQSYVPDPVFPPTSGRP